MQPSPLDFMQADQVLSTDALAAAHSALSMWTLEHCFPLLPYSAIVLESVPEGDIPPPHVVLSHKLNGTAGAHKNNGAGPPA